MSDKIKSLKDWIDSYRHNTTTFKVLIGKYANIARIIQAEKQKTHQEEQKHKRVLIGRIRGWIEGMKLHLTYTDEKDLAELERILTWSEKLKTKKEGSK